MSKNYEALYMQHIDNQTGDLYMLAFVGLMLLSAFISVKYAMYATIPIVMLNIIGSPAKENYILFMMNSAFIVGLLMAFIKEYSVK